MYGQDSYSPWERAKIPNTNLSESVHASWLAGEGGTRKISLFDACVTDVINSYMQCAKYLGFDTGRYMGTGPDMEALLRRVSMGRTPTSTLVANVMQTAVSGTPLFEQPVLHGDKETVQRKKMGYAATSSHKPGYVMESKQRRNKGRPRQISFEDQHESVDHDDIHIVGENNETLENRAGEQNVQMNTPRHKDNVIVCEENIHKTMWAIRRMPIHCRRKCFGMTNRSKCASYIESRSPGEVAPCFWSAREYNGKSIYQWMWFCNSDVQHTWNVDKQIKIVPQLPRIWPISIGTNISPDEVKALREAGFNLNIGSETALFNDGGADVDDITPPSSKRAKKWRHGISKEAEKKIALALELNAKVIEEACVKPNEHVIFHILTEAYYDVHIKAEPFCTCPDFQKREEKKKPFLACKHMYFVYLRVLGLHQNQHMSMHQPILQERDLHFILGQPRLLKPAEM